MALSQWKTPQELFVDSLCRGLRHILLYFLVFITEITTLAFRPIAKFAHFQNLNPIVLPWFSTSRVGISTRLMCRALNNVSPLAAFMVIFTTCSLPIVVGATLEQDEGEIEYLVEELKILINPYLLHLGFLAGIFITCSVPRLLPVSHAARFVAQDVLQTARPVIELIGHHVSIPGDFPFIASNKMVDEIQYIISKKNQQIESLRLDLQNEDDELADQLAQKDGEISRMQLALRHSDNKMVRLEVEKSRVISQAIAATKQKSSGPATVTNHTRVLEEKPKISGDRKADLDGKLKSIGKQTVYLKKEISDLHTAQRQEAADNDQKLKTAMTLLQTPSSTMSQECRDQIALLEAQISRYDQDSATIRQSAVREHDQRIQQMESQLASHDRDAAQARQIITDSYKEDTSRIQAQLAERERNLASVQTENSGLQHQVAQADSRLASIQQNYNAREERLEYLESQCDKANHLYKAYQKLVQDHQTLQQQHRLHQQHVTSSLAKLNTLQRELSAAKKQITELSVAKRQLETGNNAALGHPLVTIALAEKDKQLTKARQVIETLNENLVTTRRDGGPSTEFLNLHESLKKDRRALQDKVKNLERKFFTLENNASKVQARERGLALQLSRLQPAKRPEPPISLYAKGTEVKMLEEVQAERDELRGQCHDQGAKAHAMVDAALATVDRELAGNCEAEVNQNCDGLDEELRARVKSLVGKLRWRLQSGSAEAKLLQDQHDIQQVLQQTGTEPGQADKRKGRQEAERAEDEERRKRQQA